MRGPLLWLDGVLLLGLGGICTLVLGFLGELLALLVRLAEGDVLKRIWGAIHKRKNCLENCLEIPYSRKMGENQC